VLPGIGLASPPDGGENEENEMTTDLPTLGLNSDNAPVWRVISDRWGNTLELLSLVRLRDFAEVFAEEDQTAIELTLDVFREVLYAGGEEIARMEGSVHAYLAGLVRGMPLESPEAADILGEADWQGLWPTVERSHGNAPRWNSSGEFGGDDHDIVYTGGVVGDEDGFLNVDNMAMIATS